MTTERHVEKAREIVAAYPDDLFTGHPIQFAIATALAEAEREATEKERRRAAEIARKAPGELAWHCSCDQDCKAIAERIENG